jgi:hypothetical protein
VETLTRTLHRLTSYSSDRDWDEPVDDPSIVRDLVTNDIERFPWFTKRYPGQDLPRIALPRNLPTTTAPAVAVLAGTAGVPPTAMDLAQLGRILHLSAGVVRTTERPYATWLFRAAGSAGGRFPLEVYLAVPERGDLPAGVHWYDPVEHALLQVGPPPSGEAPAIIVTGVPWRTGWRYAERGFRHVYWDAGTMVSQLLAAAASAGVPASLRTRFPDAQVTDLVGADAIHEWPVAVVSLGDGPPPVKPAAPATRGEIDTAPVGFPLVTAAQHAGDLEVLGDRWLDGSPVALDDPPVEPVEVVIATRGSIRRLDPAGRLPRSTLMTSMAVAMRGVAFPHRVVVHAVDGLEPGVYRWPDMDQPAVPGAMREELYRVCLEQDLGRDAAFVVIGCADVASLDDRTYREANLAAGLVEGRLHLLATALGAAASGMTFLDSEIAGLLDEPLDAMLFTCVGVPEYRSAVAGPPGAPTRVRSVRPRTS